MQMMVVALLFMLIRAYSIIIYSQVFKYFHWELARIINQLTPMHVVLRLESILVYLKFL